MKTENTLYQCDFNSTMAATTNGSPPPGWKVVRILDPSANMLVEIHISPDASSDPVAKFLDKYAVKI